MIASYARCKMCGTILQSLHRHDYKKCSCDNETMLDGGLDYQRYGGHDMNLVEPFCFLADDDFEVVRKHAYRCGYGKSGKEAFRITRLFEMTNEHLQGVLAYGCPEWQRDLIEKEIAYRINHTIIITD